MKIAAIVVTYNRKEYLLKNIEALLGQKDAAADIYVIDNGSTDGTADAIGFYIENGQIIYRNTGQNLGGAGGFHYGVRAAYLDGYEYFWLMDDDTYPEVDALQRLVRAHQMLEGRYGFLAGMALWRDGSPCEMNVPKFQVGISPDGAYRRLRQATFVSLFLPRDTVRQVGLPIKEFFIWGDDVEYTRRISAQFPAYFVEESRVLHDTKNNVGSDIVRDDERLERYRFAYRNEMYTACHEGAKRMAYQYLKILYHIGKVLLFSKQKMRKIRLILSASKEGFAFDPPIEYVDC